METLAYQIEPASCTEQAYTFDEFEKVCADLEQDGDYAIEDKLDGRRYLLQGRPNGANYNFLTSRRVSKRTSNYVEKQESEPKMRDWLILPRDTILDGELYADIDGATSNEAATAIKNGESAFCCWDLLMFKGEDLRHLPYRKRRVQLKQLFEWLGARKPEWLRLSKARRTDFKAHLATIRREGKEGLILKDRNAPYGKGWSKIKDADTADCVVIGVNWATEGKYAAHKWIKNIRLGQYVPFDQCASRHMIGAAKRIGERMMMLVEVGKVSSGLDEALRAKISKDPERYHGRVAMLSFQQRFAPKGAFRSARFEGWHPDKNSYECLLPKKFWVGFSK